MHKSYTCIASLLWLKPTNNSFENLFYILLQILLKLWITLIKENRFEALYILFNTFQDWNFLGKTFLLLPMELKDWLSIIVFQFKELINFFHVLEENLKPFWKTRNSQFEAFLHTWLANFTCSYSQIAWKPN
jgi:hypothetical protein